MQSTDAISRKMALKDYDFKLNTYRTRCSIGNKQRHSAIGSRRTRMMNCGRHLVD